MVLREKCGILVLLSTPEQQPSIRAMMMSQTVSQSIGDVELGTNQIQGFAPFSLGFVRNYSRCGMASRS